MDWRPGKWKLHIKGTKERWLAVLAAGLILLILAFPMGGKGQKAGGNESFAGLLGLEESAGGNSGSSQGAERAGISFAGGQQNGGLGSGGERGSQGSGVQGEPSPGGDSRSVGGGGEDSVQAASGGAVTYEQQLEARLKELLSHVDGVGEVEVMIVLKSSEERVWRTDRNSSYSSTKETDSSGGTRDIQSREVTEDTILTGQGSGEGPLLEKELKPQIGGVVVSAQGGGSPAVQAEISAAVEALFDVPSHKIKVLKRAE